jgi:zinc protease
MNEVFGGGFAARLFSRVRSDKGLAYSVGGGVGSSFGYPGVFQLVMSTKSETMAAGVDALKKEIDGIIGDDPATADELKRAKEAILNSFVFNYQSKGQILSQQMQYAYYGFPADYLETYRANIDKVTREDVNRVAKKYMHPDQLITLVVGKPADFDREPSSFGEVAMLDITIPPPPDTRKAVQRNAATLEEGSKVFARAAGLLAGSAAKVKAVQASYTLNLTIGGQSMALGQDVAYELPSKMRQTIKTPMGEQVSVLNGTAGVAMGGGQTRPMSEAQVVENLDGLRRELLVLSGLGNSPGFEAVASGEQDVDGVSCELVSVAYQTVESQLCIDADGRVLKQAYQGKHPMQGTPGLIEILFQEYDEIDGRQIPRKRVMTFEGQQLATITLDEIEFNPDLDPSLFEIPE